MFIKKINKYIVMNYERLYQENPEDFKFSMHQLNKRINAYLMSEEKIPKKDFDELYNLRQRLENIFITNISLVEQLIEKINDSNKGYLDSVADYEKYLKLKGTHEEIERLITDIFDTFDKYATFYNSNSSIEYTYDSFNRLIETLNLKPKFTHKLSAPKLSSKQLDQLSRHYMKVVDGVDEYLEKNELINLGNLEKILNTAEEECAEFFGDYNRFLSPAMPKVTRVSKFNGHNSEDLSLPAFFDKLSLYLRTKIKKFYSNKPGKEQIEMTSVQEVEKYIGNNNPLSKEK